MPMPLYEYRCACGAEFETLVRTSSQADEQSCPTCGADHVRRLLSVFSAPNANRGFDPVREGPMAPRATGSDGASMMGVGGGCCGGACGSC